MTGLWKRRSYFLIVGTIVAADQLTKQLIVLFLPLGEEVRLFSGTFIWIQHVLNPGMAFGLRFLPPLALLLISLLATLGLTAFILLSKNLPNRHGIPLAMILGGAIGNLIDRILYGQVIDFISIDLPDFLMTRWPTFNVADSCVSVGVLILMLITIFEKNDQPEPKLDLRTDDVE